jgi:hypothetical protein
MWSAYIGEQTYWQNQILDKLSKTVLGQNVEKIFKIDDLVQNAEFYQTGLKAKN